jgi:hypothetical protein
MTATRRPTRDRWSNRRGLPRDLIRSALASPGPVDLLALVSTMLGVAARDVYEPFRGTRRDRGQMSIEDLIETLVEADCIESTAVLAVMELLSQDGAVRARVRRELQARPVFTPSWLTALHQATPYAAVESAHVLGDVNELMIAVNLPGGQEFSVVVSIDHNLGSAVTDAFVVPESLGQLLDSVRGELTVRGSTWGDLDLAGARSQIMAAVQPRLWPDPYLESDTWPALRPLVEWVARLLPRGGRRYRRPVWPRREVKALVVRFFESPFAAGLDDPRDRYLVESIVQFGADLGTGDPTRWSPAAVEILLRDRIPKTIGVRVGGRSQAPDLLRAFIRFCHRESGVSDEVTAATLAAVDNWGLRYQLIIRSPEPHGQDVMPALTGNFDDRGRWSTPYDSDRWAPPYDDEPWSTALDDEPWSTALDERPFSYKELLRGPLQEMVGGQAALESLDDEPLPDETFAGEGIEADVALRVGEVVVVCDRFADDVLDVEYRTAFRRFLARVAVRDAELFRRPDKSEAEKAAAVCWSVGRANNLFAAQDGPRLRVKEMMGHFGLSGTVSVLGKAMIRGGGFVVGYDATLGSPKYLVSRRRREIMDERDKIEAMKDS